MSMVYIWPPQKNAVQTNYTPKLYPYAKPAFLGKVLLELGDKGDGRSCKVKERSGFIQFTCK